MLLPCWDRRYRWSVHVETYIIHACGANSALRSQRVLLLSGHLILWFWHTVDTKWSTILNVGMFLLQKGVVWVRLHVCKQGFRVVPGRPLHAPPKYLGVAPGSDPTRAILSRCLFGVFQEVTGIWGRNSVTSSTVSTGWGALSALKHGTYVRTCAVYWPYVESFPSQAPLLFALWSSTPLRKFRFPGVWTHSVDHKCNKTEVHGGVPKDTNAAGREHLLFFFRFSNSTIVPGATMNSFF